MLSTDTLDRLNDIFIAKGWDLSNDPYKLFNRFTVNLERLEQEDQDFILHVTKNYNVYSSGDYEAMLAQCLNKLNDLNYFGEKNIKVSPLLPYSELEHVETDFVFRYTTGERKVKSSNFVCYLFKSNQMSYLKYLINQKIEVLNFLNKDDIEQLLTDEHKLLLVDDYIGSGGTALTTIKTYLRLGIKRENIRVLSLLVDQKGELELRKLGIEFIKSDYEYNTLYTLYNSIDDDIRKKLNRIARKLKVTRSYKSGYQETMALVSLVRTPNNTLPFYWSDKHDRGIQAPFPRFKE